MTTPAEIRDAVARLTTAAVGDRAAVYPYPPGGLQLFPAIVVGRASWAPGPNAWLSEWTVPVEVIVAQPGIDDEATVAELERLWPDVLQALSDAIDTDQTLGGVVQVAQIERAVPGQTLIGGTRYPATSISIQLHG